jgi:hypothetical protein
MSPEEIEERIEILFQLPTLQRSVYVMAASNLGPCKIGFTISTERRLKLFRSQLRMPELKVRYAIAHDNAAAVEQASHGALKHFRDHLMPGREWFLVDVQTAISVVSEAALKIESRKSRWRRNPEEMKRWFRSHQKYPCRHTPEALLNYKTEL